MAELFIYKYILYLYNILNIRIGGCEPSKLHIRISGCEEIGIRNIPGLDFCPVDNRLARK